MGVDGWGVLLLYGRYLPRGFPEGRPGAGNAHARRYRIYAPAAFATCTKCYAWRARLLKKMPVGLNVSAHCTPLGVYEHARTHARTHMHAHTNRHRRLEVAHTSTPRAPGILPAETPSVDSLYLMDCRMDHHVLGIRPPATHDGMNVWQDGMNTC